MNVLDLFSGIGGFSLGLERAGMRTVAFCEIEPWCRRLLGERWPGVPVYDDVRSLTADEGRSVTEGICAHCRNPLPDGWQRARIKKLHPECRAAYRKENCRKRALDWRNNNTERARRTGRNWYERNPEYQIRRLHRMSLLASAMEKLLEEAGISVDQFLEMENGSSAISRQLVGETSPMVRSQS